jgi:hypothetical protein
MHVYNLLAVIRQQEHKLSNFTRLVVIRLSGTSIGNFFFN